LLLIVVGGYQLVTTEESAAKHSDIWLSGYWMSEQTRRCPAVSWHRGFCILCPGDHFPGKSPSVGEFDILSGKCPGIWCKKSGNCQEKKSCQRKCVLDCHLSYGITQCYLPPDTSEHTPAR